VAVLVLSANCRRR